MDCHEPHPAPNEKMQPIQWTERPTGALVGANSLWPNVVTHRLGTGNSALRLALGPVGLKPELSQGRSEFIYKTSGCP